jgi:hypothetical protein
MDTSGDDRFIEDGDNVFFPKAGLCFHKLFVNRFRGTNFISARRLMKKYFSRRQKDEIIHYLKNKGILKSYKN